MKAHPHAVLFCGIALLACAAPSSLRADDKFWNSFFDGAFNDASSAANYDIAASNACFAVVTTLTPAFTGASGGTPIGSTDPWANFSY